MRRSLSTKLDLGVGAGGGIKNQGMFAFGGIGIENYPITYTRNSRVTIEDYQGNLKTIEANNPAYWGYAYDSNDIARLILDDGTKIHPSNYFEFKGSEFPRLAHYESWVGATTAVSLGKRIAPGNGTWWYCTTAGTTDGTEPADWSSGASPITDGSVVWTYGGLYQDKIGLLVEPQASTKNTNFAFPPADEEQANLVADPTFEGTTWWAGSGTSGRLISGGVCTYTSVADGVGIFKSGVVTQGKVYKVVFEVVSISSGGFAPLVGTAGDVGTTRTEVGVYTETLVCGAGTTLSIAAVGTTSGVIDNVYAYEIRHAIGTKATAASPTAIDGFTCTGDAAGFLHIRAATAAEITKFGNCVDAAGNVFADKIIEWDNSAGAGVFNVDHDGAATNLATASQSVYSALSAGTANMRRSTTATGQVAMSGTTITRYKQENFTAATGDLLRIEGAAGSVGTIFGGNLVEQAYISSVILTAGAAATRAAVDVVTNSTISANDYTVLTDIYRTAIISTADTFIDCYVSSSDRFYMYFSGSAGWVNRKVVGGASYLGYLGTSTSLDTVIRGAGRCSSVTGVDGFLDGLKGNVTDANTSDTNISGMTTHIGRRGDDTNPVVAILKNLFIFHSTETDANMQTITGYDGEA